MNRLIYPFLSTEKFKKFFGGREERHVFGIGISFRKSDSEILSVRAILRDKYEFPISKGLVTDKKDKAALEFFNVYPKDFSDSPQDGLHGLLAAYKNDLNGDEKFAFYRRLDGVPFCYCHGSWAYYKYGKINKNDFPSLADRNILKYFSKETKISMSSDKESVVTYPNYEMLQSCGSLKAGFEGVWPEDVFKDELFDINLKIQRIKKDGLTLVAIGEDSLTVKAYFVDFQKVFLPTP